MTLIDVPGGRLRLGLSPERLAALEAEAPAFPYYRETPELPVSVAPFRIARAPVTNAEYLEFVRAGGYESPAHWTADVALLDAWGGRAALVDRSGRPGPSTWSDGRFPEGEDDHPVHGVSWLEARAYARFRGLRLPTEQEWELAARGTDGRLYPWGDAFDPERCVVGRAGTEPIGGRPEGRSTFGLEDMAGLVADWCEDVYRPYARDRSDGPVGDRVLRGDGFRGDAITVRVTVRTGHPPSARRAGLGLRLAGNPSFGHVRRTLRG